MKTKLLLLLLLSLSTFAQTNLVTNGDFEDWSSSSQPDNWFRFFSGFVSQSTTAQNGSSSTKLKITGSTNFINSKTFAVQANKTYRVTMYHRVASGTLSSVELSLYHQPNTFKEKFTQISDITFSSSQWRKLELVYTSTVAENIEVDIWATGVTGSDILLDNVSVVDIDEPVAQYTSIPDINFENKLIALGLDFGVPDGKVSTANIASLTGLNISQSSINDLTGIEDFVSLKNLDFSYNNVTSVNLSKNINLVSLNCVALYPEGLESLDLSNNVLLEELNCTGNKLVTLDLSKNISLIRLAYSRGEDLISINLQNGNNKKIQFLAFPSPQLKCVQVDDVDYSNANWSYSKTANTIFSLNCNTLGIEDSVFDKAVLYPNPTKGEVNINNIALEKATVYNSLGQLVKTFILNSSNTNNTINLSGLPKGVYYVYLINQDAALAKKVIVE
ncbi:T9SS type A sorting domain-containing protein [Flavobacterium aquidurense]|uniref:Por secretion system C-terminal sorting domain-containing protein n=1 Tax=Flavobacterium aquidurense TaxID=362413 RepID=A0A0Q1BEA4_9FLAO|nr:T9SS type A sorting domain-containing protein [Flavobacterium aquidurense]KQB38714.1 Por secretion system C-terminal sorting domain-containing protein [Flavobacterium aquidurense]